ncbi:MAG: hypothetical protein WBL27_09000 [Salinimicrobium sp.]
MSNEFNAQVFIGKAPHNEVQYTHSNGSNDPGQGQRDPDQANNILRKR